MGQKKIIHDKRGLKPHNINRQGERPPGIIIVPVAESSWHGLQINRTLGAWTRLYTLTFTRQSVDIILYNSGQENV